MCRCPQSANDSDAICGFKANADSIRWERRPPRNLEQRRLAEMGTKRNIAVEQWRLLCHEMKTATSQLPTQ